MREMDVAIDAVRRAGELCQKVRESLVSAEMVSKMDKSPVTVADFGAQAVIVSAIRREFPGDLIVAEEDAALLRGEDGAELCSRVFEYVKDVYPDMSESEMLDAIDGGQYEGGAEGRFWTLDPIDGTKGFIRGDQYAVALGLIVDGEVVQGVLGCPNLPVDGVGRGEQGAGSNECGVILSACRGEGAYARTMNLGRTRNDERGTMKGEIGQESMGIGQWSGGVLAGGADRGEGTPAPVRMKISVSEEGDPSRAVFCESVEAAHTAHGVSADVVNALGVVVEPVRIDSQCKYAVVARGDAGVYMRLPTRADYEEKIWDHAAGVVIVEEAGGKVTDVIGKKLDFSQGRTLKNNKGVIVTNGLLHDAVLGEVGKG